VGFLERIKANRPQGKKGLTLPSAYRSFPFWNIGTYGSNEERIENNFESYVSLAFKGDGVVFSVINTRQFVFSEARFAWRDMRNGRPTELFTTADLSLLERPAPSQTTGDLLSRMEIVSSLAGNFYCTTADDLGRIGKASVGGPGRRIVYLRPDWVTIVIGTTREGEDADPNSADAKILAYKYDPIGGVGSSGHADSLILLPDEVCHYAPIPDPDARFRGMSWLTPVLREIMADRAATEHKAKFFENGASPGIAIKFDKDTDEDAFDEFVENFKSAHQGSYNAYKTLFLTGGADVTPISLDLKAIDFKAVQGAGETRIANAGRVHPTVIGLAEGMQGSSLNAGNYQAARRSFVDGTMRPLWRSAAASLQPLLTVPQGNGVHLWYDARDISFLRDDQKDVAAIHAQEASMIRTLTDAGYTAESVVDAITNDGDWRRLKHSGLFSVQLQPPMPETPTEEPGTTNTEGNDAAESNQPSNS
jgi:phage portal protein BeeE